MSGEACYCSTTPPDVCVDPCFCGNAYQMVEGFEHGERRFFLSKGQFSLVDIAIALIQQIGACDLECAVWTGTQNSLNRVESLVQDQLVRSTRWILCDSQRSMNEERLEHLIELFGVESVRVSPLHAKLLTLRNDDWSIVVQTSANLTKNRSVEQFDVTDSRELYGFVHHFFDYVFETHPSLAEEPPYDGWEYDEVEARYQAMCVEHRHDDDSLDSLLKELNRGDLPI